MQGREAARVGATAAGKSRAKNSDADDAERKQANGRGLSFALPKTLTLANTLSLPKTSSTVSAAETLVDEAR